MWISSKLIFLVFLVNVNCEERVDVTRYSVILYTDIDEGNLTFSGEATIIINILEELESITLFHEGLSITNVIVKNDSNLGGDNFDSDFRHVEQYQTLITLNNNERFKAATRYNLNVAYNGAFPEEFLGFYNDDENNKNYFLGVSFKSKAFQSVFPSIEKEDHLNFKLFVSRGSNYHVIANGPPASTQQNPNQTTFDEVKDIKTSSISFFISKFDSISKENVTLYGIKSNMNHFNEALEIATQIIKKFEELFEYSLGKMSLIAVPKILINDISTCNLIFFNQFNLFYHGNLSSIEQREKILHHVAFAIAQQFFGNIITTTSQSDSFITEGLASFYEHFILSQMSAVEHENITKLFGVEILQKAFEIDSSLLTEPLMTSKLIPADEFNLFTRYKACSIMRMMESVLGNETFTRGVKKLLNDHKNKSIILQDFYDALLSETDINSETFNAWMTQKGYPIVTVEVVDESKLKLSQERFNLNHSEALWNVPLTYLTSEGEKQMVWLNDSGQIIDFPDDNWPIFNFDQIGYYRMNYDETLWNYLIEKLKLKEIPIAYRAALISDAFSLALIDKISYEIALDVLSYLTDENDLIPWRTAHEELKFLDAMLFSSSIYSKFKNFVIELITPHLEILSSENYNLKSIILFWTCQMEMEECFVRNLLPELIENRSAINPNDRKMIICNAVKFINETLFNESILMLLSLEGDKSDWISGLACADDGYWLRNLLLLSYNETLNLSQSDKRQIFIEVLKNHRFGSMAGVLLLDMKKLILTEGEILFALEEIVKRFWDLNLMSAFSNLGLSDIESYPTYVELARDKLEWFNTNKEEIENFLDSRRETTTASSDSTETEMTTTEEITTGRTSLKTINSSIIVLMIYGVINV